MADLSALEREVDGILAEYGDLTDLEMRRVLDGHASVGTLYDMMRYHIGWTDESFRGAAKGRGKRFRPAMCLLTCEALGGDRTRALPAAAAIELVHNFSLIHDDIEDGDRVRRGRPTVWALWGLPQGINTGDGMHALANLSALDLRRRGVADADTLAVLQVLDRAILELCEGQHLDLANETRDITAGEYLEVITKKTAALIECATHIGAILGTQDEPTRVRFAKFGRTIGLAFQIRDDVLGVFSPGNLGKQGSSDILRKKRNLPYLLALEHASEAARLRSIYSQETLTDEDEREVLEIFRQAGVEARCEEAAQRHESEAFAVLAGLPGPNLAAERLLRVAQFLVWRQR